MRWEQQHGGSWYAYAGKHIIGMVVPLTDGSCVDWRIGAVTGSKYQHATQGECGTVARAKRSLRNAWLLWLDERGLTEAPEAKAS